GPRFWAAASVDVRNDLAAFPDRDQRRHLALNTACRTRVNDRKRLRWRRIGIDRWLQLGEVDIALEIRCDRDEPAEVVDRELARIVAGFGCGRRSEEQTRRQRR